MGDCRLASQFKQRTPAVPLDVPNPFPVYVMDRSRRRANGPVALSGDSRLARFRMRSLVPTQLSHALHSLWFEPTQVPISPLRKPHFRKGSFRRVSVVGQDVPICELFGGRSSCKDRVSPLALANSGGLPPPFYTLTKIAVHPYLLRRGVAWVGLPSAALRPLSLSLVRYASGSR